jgi:hypothetical protein
VAADEADSVRILAVGQKKGKHVIHCKQGDKAMKAIELSEAFRPLSEYAKELDEDIIVLTSERKPVAALVSLKNIDRDSLASSTGPEFIVIIEAARGEFRSGRKLSLQDVKQRVRK